jgi:hypothetical protein
VGQTVTQLSPRVAGLLEAAAIAKREMDNAEEAYNATQNYKARQVLSTRIETADIIYQEIIAKVSTVNHGND